jgi:hypothetical protein
LRLAQYTIQREKRGAENKTKKKKKNKKEKEKEREEVRGGTNQQ